MAPFVNLKFLSRASYDTVRPMEGWLRLHERPFLQTVSSEKDFLSGTPGGWTLLCHGNSRRLFERLEIRKPMKTVGFHGWGAGFEGDNRTRLPICPSGGKSYRCHQFCQLVAAKCHWHLAFKWVRVLLSAKRKSPPKGDAAFEGDNRTRWPICPFGGANRIVATSF